MEPPQGTGAASGAESQNEYEEIGGDPQSAPGRDVEVVLDDQVESKISEGSHHDREERQMLVSGDGDLEWNDVNFFVRTKQGEKQILHDVKGRLPRGQLLAIMGGSGAGKSTLLNILSGRLLSEGKTKEGGMFEKVLGASGKRVQGTLAWRRQTFELGRSDAIKAVSAYVMQSDILCATQTPREALLFSAMLRLPKDMSVAEKEARVDALLAELKLTKCQDTMIGNEAIRGISGGEKKRTSVGVELVTNPDVIFLDEPTSGLDSFTAMKTLEILKEMTTQGKQVIATLHQPSSEIFAVFDQLCLLAEGHCVYFGPASKVVDYFESLGYPCPAFSNPADFVVNRIQEDPATFIEAWRKHEDARVRVDFTGYGKLSPEVTFATGRLYQLWQLLKREFQIFARDPRPSRMRLAQTVLFATLVGVLYWNLPHTQQGLRDRFGGVFFLTINSSLTGVVATIITFPEQRLLFERERNNNMYYTWSYVASKFLVGMPEQALFAFLYCIICYWMVGFDSTFGQLYLLIAMCVMASGSLGLLIGCFADNAAEGMQLMPATFIPNLLFANFIVSLDQIPSFIRWLQWIDIFKYTVDAICITEFRGETYSLDTVNGEKSGFRHGGQYLDYIGSDPGDKFISGMSRWAADVLCLFFLFMGFRMITMLILIKRNGF